MTPCIAASEPAKLTEFAMRVSFAVFGLGSWVADANTASVLRYCRSSRNHSLIGRACRLSGPPIEMGSSIRTDGASAPLCFGDAPRDLIPVL